MELEGPVTVLVRHRVKVGKEADFEAWLRDIIKDAAEFEGYLGFNIIRPSDAKRPEYVVFFRFDTYDRLERWEGSNVRRQRLTELEGITVQPPTRERHTGLEVWFTPMPGQAPPPRWKMAVITAVTIYPLILLVQFLLGPLLNDLHLLVRSLISAVLLVIVMTYAAMPLMTRLFSRWLHGPAE